MGSPRIRRLPAATSVLPAGPGAAAAAAATTSYGRYPGGTSSPWPPTGSNDGLRCLEIDDLRGGPGGIQEAANVSEVAGNHVGAQLCRGMRDHRIDHVT